MKYEHMSAVGVQGIRLTRRLKRQAGLGLRHVPGPKLMMPGSDRKEPAAWTEFQRVFRRPRVQAGNLRVRVYPAKGNNSLLVQASVKAQLIVRLPAA